MEATTRWIEIVGNFIRGIEYITRRRVDEFNKNQFCVIVCGMAEIRDKNADPRAGEMRRWHGCSRAYVAKEYFPW